MNGSDEREGSSPLPKSVAPQQIDMRAKDWRCGQSRRNWEMTCMHYKRVGKFNVVLASSMSTSV